MSDIAKKLANKSASSGQRPAPKGAEKQVRLKLVYVDVWSAARLSFIISLALSIAFILASFLVWQIVDKLGLYSQVDDMISELTSGSTDLSVTSIFGLGRVMGFAMLIGIVHTVLGTVLGGLVALLYNLSVRLTGGLQLGFTNVRK